ncbi:MAG: hypothetical protein Q8N05_15305 [Bacteroidota bacterium]|nr:hypothetical protein [Bacteroidota bacterium]
MNKIQEPLRPDSLLLRRRVGDEAILPLGERLDRGFGDEASFPSKLLLFGEYGLMFDAMALSVPFNRFSGYLDLDADQSHQESSAEIRKFYEHLKTGDSSLNLHFSFNLDRLEEDIQNGLYFNSNIPQQYGVGSSGALVAALFSRYTACSVPQNEPNPELLKADFAILESYFHGRSSGLDPLISFLNLPILLDTKKTVQPVQLDLAQTGLSIALIDTKTTGATGPLVQHFIDQMNYPDYELAFETQFIPANNGCIESLLNGKKRSFFLFLEKLIQFQLGHFQRMIPVNFHAVISGALKEKVFIKLLGSGGGGFLIAFAESGQVIKTWAEKHGIQLQVVAGS